VSGGGVDQVVGRVAERRRGHVHLVVRGVVHEDVVVRVAVEQLHLLLVDDGALHLLARSERPLDHRTGAHVAQRGAHERPALARLDVLELADLEQAVVEVDGHAVLEVCGGDL
jgi:alanyl-tRNA synthetase